MVLPPAGPPPPTGVPEGWKAHWNVDYKAWFYENIYTEESVWEKPTQPVYPPRATARLPPGPPPGYQAIQQPEPAEKDVDAASLPSDVAAVSLSDGNQYSNPQSKPRTTTQLHRNPLSQGILPLQTAPRQKKTLPCTAPPPKSRANPPSPRRRPPTSSSHPTISISPALRLSAPTSLISKSRLSSPSSPSSPRPTLPQPDALQPNYLAQSAPAPAAGGGFMSKLQSKVVNKVPGGTNTLLGVGGALLAGAVLEHGWDKHEERERRRRGW